MMYLLLAVLVIWLSIAAIGYFLSAPKYKGPVTDHFDGKKFINVCTTKSFIGDLEYNGMNCKSACDCPCDAPKSSSSNDDDEDEDGDGGSGGSDGSGSSSAISSVSALSATMAFLVSFFAFFC